MRRSGGPDFTTLPAFISSTELQYSRASSHVMGGGHYRHTAGILPPQVVPESEAGLRVEAGGGFVQEHYFRIADQGERDVDSPLLAAGEGAVLLGKALA